MSPANTMNYHRGDIAATAMRPTSVPAFPVASKQATRRVSFNPRVTVQPVHHLANTQEEKSQLYYNKDDLKTRVKVIFTSFESKEPRDTFSVCSAYPAKEQDCCMVRLEDDPSLRGLEFFMCPIRTHNRVLALKALIKHNKNLQIAKHTKTTDEEKLLSLAAASAKLSRWSKLVALETARLDSIRVYDDRDYVIPINERIDISPFPPTKASTKRRRIIDEENSQGSSKRRT